MGKSIRITSNHPSTKYCLYPLRLSQPCPFFSPTKTIFTKKYSLSLRPNNGLYVLFEVSWDQARDFCSYFLNFQLIALFIPTGFYLRSPKTTSFSLKHCFALKKSKIVITWTIDDWKHMIFSDETKIHKFNSDGKSWCWVGNDLGMHDGFWARSMVQNL